MSNILTIKLTEFKSHDGSTYGCRIYDNYGMGYLNNLDKKVFNQLKKEINKEKVFFNILNLYYDENTNFFTDGLDNYSGILVDGEFLDLKQTNEKYLEGIAL